MKTPALLLFLVLSLPACGPRAEAMGKMSGDSMSVSRWAANSQGRISSGGGFSLNTSVGEPAYSASASGAFRVNPGYMKLAAQPGSVVSITALTKSTGTLELSWIAPGADGFQGNIGSGVYRVDYSSDSGHVFAPTLFKLEFSTSVTPGALQQLSIPGLQPNTTYYTKIYTGDDAKVIAETSALSAESTLSDLPVNPVFSAVSACNVTISWLLPSSGAEGYDLQSSTTSFGILSPGGDITTVATPNGLQVNLTVKGLAAHTNYFFRVASLNWQGDKNFTTVLATTTAAGTCYMPISGLSAAGNALSRAVTLTWINPSAPSPEGIVVILSTNSAAAGLSDGTDVRPGQILADGSVVKSTSAAASLNDSGLTLDTTFFYHLMAKYTGPVYSVGVSTEIFLDLPPMAPAGLTAVVNAGRTAATINWTPVASNLDGSAFAPAAPPREVELAYYRVEKSSSVADPYWVTVATLPVTAHSFTDPIAPGDPAFVYRVSAIDSLNSHDQAMGVDTNHSVYIFTEDQVARLNIPADVSGEMLAANNSSGADLLIRTVNEGPDVRNHIFNSVRFEAVKSPGNQALDQFTFSRPALTVAMRYQVAGNRVVASGAGALENIPANEAAQRLGLYWNNGEKFVKLYGKVDTISQLISVQSAMTGGYQIRTLYRDSGVHFDLSGLSNKAITPNGDGLNDTAVFTFDNPRDSAFSGAIYDLRGAFVSDMTGGPVSNSLQWDGKAGGRPVSGGAYVYQIKAEGKTFNGTLLVIK
ncbi:MAG: gliding motility-associated C-terminal domain-containing protein [Elusimicrobiales bacterium]|jgi:hypothetical protein